LTTVKNKVKHPKACFTIEYHLCHIDDQSILAAVVQLVAKKMGKENFPNVNLVLSICQLSVLGNTYQMISKNVILTIILTYLS
jgi:hypothetical protein